MSWDDVMTLVRLFNAVAFIVVLVWVFRLSQAVRELREHDAELAELIQWLAEAVLARREGDDHR